MIQRAKAPARSIRTNGFMRGRKMLLAPGMIPHKLWKQRQSWLQGRTQIMLRRRKTKKQNKTKKKTHPEPRSDDPAGKVLPLPKAGIDSTPETPLGGPPNSSRTDP